MTLAAVSLLINLSKRLLHSAIAEMGVAFQHCNFFFQFFKKYNRKKIFNLFYSNFFSIISEKEVKIFFFKIFFSKMFFEKLNYFFSIKAKLVTLCHHLGKARVKLKNSSKK